jgi:hypothetical protein
VLGRAVLVAQRRRQQLRDVDRAPPVVLPGELTALLDLGPAAEPVRHHRRVAARRPEGGQQPVLPSVE